MATKIDASTLDLQEKMVALNRVSKTVKVLAGVALFRPCLCYAQAMVRIRCPKIGGACSPGGGRANHGAKRSYPSTRKKHAQACFFQRNLPFRQVK